MHNLQWPEDFFRAGTTIFRALRLLWLRNLFVWCRIPKTWPQAFYDRTQEAGTWTRAQMCDVYRGFLWKWDTTCQKAWNSLHAYQRCMGTFRSERLISQKNRIVFLFLLRTLVSCYFYGLFSKSGISSQIFGFFQND